MITFLDAREKILEYSKKLSTQEFLLSEIVGHVVAGDIYAPIVLPPFDNSAMDGFAINSGEIAEGENIEISQIIRAGDVPRPLIKRTCAKIMTGAMLPDGANTVIPIEDVVAGENIVTFNKPFKNGQHVRYKGEDVKKGELIVAGDTVANIRTIALLAALGFEKIPVFRYPRVGIITTGSELQAPGTSLSQGKIFDSNSEALRAALKEIGIYAEVTRIRDDREKILGTIRESLERLDILITIGGISVGDCDFVKEAFDHLDVKEIFHKVAIKPGKPLYFGIVGDTKLVFGLPGNPVSSLITFHQFVRPAIYKMMGKNYHRQIRHAIAASPLKGSKDKTDFLRGISQEENGLLYVNSAGSQGAAMLKPLTISDCIIIIPEDCEFIEKGKLVEVESW